VSIHQAELSATSLRYAACGDGPPLIIVPATISLIEDWTPMIQFVGQRYRTYFFEMPGHGSSTPLAEGYSSERIAQVIAGLADHVGAERFALLGFSFGGILALRALLRRVRPEALTDQLAFDRLVINELERRVEWDGQTIHPSPTGYRFLAGLVDEPSHMLRRPQILRRVWGNVPDRSRQIDQVVKSLRLLLRPLQAEHLIETVRGAGYRLHALSKE
jgi:pimeloyl-ACP methyl ester carboxylesterase